MFKYLKKFIHNLNAVVLPIQIWFTVDIMELLNNDEKIQKFILSMVGTGISPDKASELCVKVIEAQLHKQSHDGNFISNTYFKLNITLFFD
jgi:hypothetical protein